MFHLHVLNIKRDNFHKSVATKKFTVFFGTVFYTFFAVSMRITETILLKKTVWMMEFNGKQHTEKSEHAL